MSLDDIKHAMPNTFAAKILATAITVAVSGGGGWLVSTTVNDHGAIFVLTEDIHNLVSVVRDSKGDTDSALNRLVNIQEAQDREISRLEQAVRDRMKIEVAP